MNKCFVPAFVFALFAVCVAVHGESYLSKSEATDGVAFRRAFVSAVQVAGPAVVEVRVGGKRVALGCVVSAEGWVLTKASEVQHDTMRNGEDAADVLAGLPEGGVLCVRQDGTRWPALVVARDRATDLMLLKVAAPLEPWAFVDLNDGVLDGDAPSTPEALEIGRWLVVPGVGAALRESAGGVLAVGVVSTEARAVASRAKMGVFFASGSIRPMVRFVQPESGAALAGLRSGDVLLSVDGRATPTPLEVVQWVSGRLAGDAVLLQVQRGGAKDGEELMMKVVLGLGPDRPGDRSARMNRASGPVSQRRSGFVSAFQHDALIGPSFCGGPVVSLDGELVGINIARSGRVGVLALPMDQVRAALRRMLDEDDGLAVP